MKRLAAVIAVALVLAALLVVALMPAVASAAPPPDKNKNGGEVVLTLEDGTEVTIWVNFVGSDRSGENPAHVVDGSDAQVFKVTGYEVGGLAGDTRFPSPPPFDPVTATHDSPEGLVTLTGVFIP